MTAHDREEAVRALSDDGPPGMTPRLAEWMLDYLDANPTARAALARYLATGEGLRLSKEVVDHIKALRRVAANAQDSFVGRHWPDVRAMRRDGIGFHLNDGEKEPAIRRHLYEFQPEFMVSVLDDVLAALSDSPGTQP